MALSAATASLWLSGTSTSFTNEATTKTVANTKYQITDANKRILDPAVAPVVEVDADGAGAGAYAVAAAGTYTIDMFGVVTFSADQGASATVRVSGSYLPLVQVAEVRACDVNMSIERLDTTVMDPSTTTRSRNASGYMDANGTITGLDVGVTDLDAGGGTVIPMDLMQAGTPKVLEVRLPDGKKFRAWILLKGIKGSVTTEALWESTYDWSLAAQAVNGRTYLMAYGFGS